MTTIHTIASGSSGNAAILSRDGTHLLLDAGISCRRITAALQSVGLSPTDLSGIFITHTHSDHISGLATVVKRWDVPIFASAAACRDLSYRLAGIERLLQPCSFGEALSVGRFSVTPFPTSHDAPGSADYRFDEAGALTDTGYVTEEASDILSGAAMLLLECNHDVDRLRSGPYPYFLKKRILGEEGHLSNDTAAAFAASMAQKGTEQFILAHLSAENNTPELARSAVESALLSAGLTSLVDIAPRNGLQTWQTEGIPCRK